MEKMARIVRMAMMDRIAQNRIDEQDGYDNKDG